uniref:Uncharacterized protein n=1 Tax=Lygus hesperus TaxID=30085 RepID=A0A146LVJ2_LYGHE
MKVLSQHRDPQVALAHKFISQGYEQHPDDIDFAGERGTTTYIPGNSMIDPYDYQIEKAFITPVADYQFQRSLYIDRVTNDKVTQSAQRISALMDQVDILHRAAVRSGVSDLPNRNALKRLQADECIAFPSEFDD